MNMSRFLGFAVALFVLFAAGSAHAQYTGYVCSVKRLAKANPSTGDFGSVQVTITAGANCTGFSQSNFIAVTTNASTTDYILGTRYDQAEIINLYDQLARAAIYNAKVSISIELMGNGWRVFVDYALRAD